MIGITKDYFNSLKPGYYTYNFMDQNNIKLGLQLTLCYITSLGGSNDIRDIFEFKNGLMVGEDIEYSSTLSANWNPIEAAVLEDISNIIYLDKYSELDDSLQSGNIILNDYKEEKPECFI